MTQKYSKKRPPALYSEGSYCSVCEHWVNEATRNPINFGLATIQGPNEGNDHYYDVTGKRVGVLIIHKIEKLARRDIDGTFLQTVKEFVKTVYCGICGHKCRGGPISKTDPKKAKPKLQITLKKDKPEPEKVTRKWVKKPEKEHYPNPVPRGRKKGVKNRIPHLMEKINIWLHDEDIPSILQQYNEAGFEYSASNGKPLDEILDIFRGSAQGSGQWKEYKEITSDDIARCKKIIIKKLKEYAKKHKLEITNETETSHAP